MQIIKYPSTVHRTVDDHIFWLHPALQFAHLRVGTASPEEAGRLHSIIAYLLFASVDDRDAKLLLDLILLPFFLLVRMRRGRIKIRKLVTLMKSLFNRICN